MRHPDERLFWIVLLSLAVAGGLAAAARTSQTHGWLGAIMGAIGGFLFTALALLGCFFLLFGLALTGEFIKRGGPRYPPCHTGKCKSRRWPSLDDRDMGDYEQVGVGDDRVLRCKCGREYVGGDGERRFMERLPDGTLKPYMVHTDYRGWVPDADENK